ncbi:MAG: hypothetical protein IPH29_01910 [Candidatus Microthrix sp.]|nr:hypothetical protein [Candidatus Microthrix sp.]
MTIDRGNEQNAPPASTQIVRAVREGGAAPAAAWAFAFLVVRLFAISGYNWDTAFLVSTTLGLEDGLRILFGSFMTARLVVAPLPVTLLPLLMAAFLWSPKGRRPTVVLLAGLALTTLTSLTLSYRAWWLLPATAAVFGVLVLIHRRQAGAPLRRLLAATIERIGWVVAIGALGVALATQTPWVPQSGSRPPTAGSPGTS